MDQFRRSFRASLFGGTRQRPSQSLRSSYRHSANNARRPVALACSSSHRRPGMNCRRRIRYAEAIATAATQASERPASLRQLLPSTRKAVTGECVNRSLAIVSSCMLKLLGNLIVKSISLDANGVKEIDDVVRRTLGDASTFVEFMCELRQFACVRSNRLYLVLSCWHLTTSKPSATRTTGHLHLPRCCSSSARHRNRLWRFAESSGLFAGPASAS